MKNRINLLFLILVLTGILLSACGSAPKVEWNLKITGAVEKSLDLRFQDLVKLPQIELNDILMNKSVGEDEVGSWSGVMLGEILDQAGAAADFTTITAIASDGYAIEITKDELKDAIIALKQNGEWIQKSDPGHGPIRLVCPQTPANRWVFQLTEIQINQ
ncbi:MAG: molybdopterin-dependent oxidoreductase [Pelolinea sp.]|nr:molybdopterin-dependent oxidoreductase [Pelolinea sp.]